MTGLARRTVWGLACALAAGGAGYWTHLGAPDTASPAVPQERAAVVATKHILSAPQNTGPSCDDLLAGKPEPGGGYSPEFDETVLKAVRERVARSPEEALSWADAATNPAWRDILCKIVVQVWAEAEPAAALEWAQSLRGEKRELAIEAALTGLAQRPAEAAVLGKKLLAAEPALADAHATMLIGALVRGNQFAAAAEIADAAPENARGEFLARVFSSWAEHEPAKAAAALAALPDGKIYEQAYRAVLKGWAAADPRAAADYALTPGAAEFRAEVLQNALGKWSEQDPNALAGWLANLPPSPEFDAGATAFLARTDGANRDTATAYAWARSIGEPALRETALARVAKEALGN